MLIITFVLYRLASIALCVVIFFEETNSVFHLELNGLLILNSKLIIVFVLYAQTDYM